MKRVVIGVIVFLVLMSLVSAQRYIIQTDKIDQLNGTIKEKIVDELNPSIGRQRASARIGASEKELVVLENVTTEELGVLQKLGVVEPDYKVKAFLNDLSWNYQKIGITDFAAGYGEGVKIAVFDTGANFNLLNISKGYDFVNEDNDPTDDNGHGTMVSQLLKNPSGFPLDAQIYAVKVLNQNGEGYVSDVVEAINWAEENEIDIVLMSFGGEDNSEIVHEVFDLAYENGILFIAASGNGGNANLFYPASYESVVSVGAVNEKFVRSSFSSYGSSLELVAPGENIVITDGVNDYLVSGTSFSAPHAGVVAASYWTEGMNNVLVRQKLKENAKDLGASGRDDQYGYGLVTYQNEQIGEVEARVGVLETWKKTISVTINNMLATLTSQGNSIKNHENRIKVLENSFVSEQNSTEEFPQYLDYLSSSDRKAIVCGYGEDNHLNSFSELGWNCTFTYKQTSRGETVRCKCGKI